jgi:3-deoxy-manno-octulosonate cytidylyltransferase (CMP-KDO synthetase)
MGATRFPGKMLYPLLDKPMILWTVEAAAKSTLADQVIVATDDDRILKTVTDAGFDARMTSVSHKCGSDRIWEIAKTLDSNWIINLQGDEPTMWPEALDSLASVALSSEGPPIEMGTLVRDLDPEEARDPNRVKVVLDLNDNAMYFSRSPIPYPRMLAEEIPGGQAPARYILHVGVYIYRRDILEKFIHTKPTPLERVEGLEQLRALENGIKIRCIRTAREFLGVDTMADVPRVEAALRLRYIDRPPERISTCDVPR